MRRILAMFSLGYLCVAVIFGIHAVIVQPEGSGNGDALSLEIIDRAIRWPVHIFD